ncbi:MAG: serine/threonine-protein kinase [Polyangiaceae bacterium]|jgi:serine/threonine-protein kinase
MASSVSPNVAAAGVSAGEILAGKYRVDRVLGVGGMGVVVAAHHMQLDDKVAIKFLLPQAMTNSEAVARFDREARAAVRIRSEHVARVIDVGKLENGAPYMVMEYLEGRDLSQWLSQNGRLPIHQAVDFLLQACEAIAEAHAMGIVHRDLKPANLYCIRRPDGALSIKVLDFGISKLTDPASGGMGMTRTQAIMGSPYYMSPEQMESSKAVDPRADIWALGVILYELITGRVPFQGEAITELVLHIVTTQPPPIAAQLRPDVPLALEQVILRCLEKDRTRRFGDVAELARALIPFSPRSALSLERIAGVIGSSGTAPASVGPTPPAPQMPQAHGMTGASWGQTGPDGATAPARSSKGVIIALAAAFGVVVLGSGLTILLARKATPSTASSPTTGAPPAATDVPAPSGSVVALEPLASAAPGATASAAPTPSETASATTAPTAVTAPPTTTKPVAGGGATHPVPVAATAAAKPKANCDPPYFVDAAGHRQYKKECF